MPGGYFSVQKEYDEKFILTDFDFARRFMRLEGELSAYELRLSDIRLVDEVKERLEAALPPGYKVLTWYEQHQTLYRVMRNEKYITYLILTLMLAIAAVNIVGSLSMIVLEKTRDIAVLKSVGGDIQLIRRIFLLEGLLVGGIGVSIGMGLAFIFGLLQEHYGIIKLYGGESFRVSAFPIEMQAADFLLIFVTVMGLSVLASLYPSRRAAQIRIAEGLHR
jgi:lipoprotein-releasing system permease protein